MARVAVAFNDDLHRKPHLNEIEKIGEAESGETAREIAAILGADIIGVGDDLRGALETLSTYDEVFNLCEGVLGIPRWEMHFATALEMLGIPFTGCEPLAVAICTDKILVKRLLAAAGVPVPRSDVLPAIVKPSREDAGVGIDAASIVFNERELHDRVKWVEGTYGQPALVEEFIDGREFNQSLFLDRALPPGEVVFADALPRHQRLVGWKAKWAAGSDEDRFTVNRTPADIDGETARRIAQLCLHASSVLNIGGYCRFDLRQRATGELCVVDVNPNPDIGRDTGFRKALDAAGIAFPDFLGATMMAARNRRKR
jgi:D-alanine-D-alanine ligase